MEKPRLEPEVLEGAPLRYAPTNEFGVVFLFSHLCRRMQLHVESVQSGFPDCIARQRVGGKERRIRIEFEFRSSSFRAHGHPADGCDWIVCWEHDWADVPLNITVVELRRYFGRGFNIWVVCSPPEVDWPTRGKFLFGKRVAKGDLVLVYEWSPKRWFRQLYAIGNEVDGGKTEFIYKINAWVGNKDNSPSYCHAVRRVCTLREPLHYKAIEADSRVAANAVFSGTLNRKITEHWWRIYEIIIRKNPELAAVLEEFSPSRV
jgi:hypothetical protein